MAFLPHFQQIGQNKQHDGKLSRFYSKIKRKKGTDQVLLRKTRFADGSGKSHSVYESEKKGYDPTRSNRPDEHIFGSYIGNRQSDTGFDPTGIRMKVTGSCQKEGDAVRECKCRDDFHNIFQTRRD